MRKARRAFFVITACIATTLSVSVLLITNPVFASGKGKTTVSVNARILRQHVDSLCGTPQPRNSANFESINMAADYIRDVFKKYADTVEEQKFKAGWVEYRNIICSFGPKDGPRLIIGAHYDVCENQPGADDNASGVAGLLELAHLLDSLKPALKYRIDLVAYSLEEPPYFRTEMMGSAVHAKYLADNKIPVIGMVSLEMIGYFSDEPKSQSYPVGLLHLFYPEKGNFIAVVGSFGQWKIVRKMKTGMITGSVIPVKSINSPKWVPGIDFSDHLNYWKYGWDAVMVTDTSWYRNDQYHEPGDTPDRLNYDKMAQVVSGVYNAVIGY
jgi:hypothetical protein